MSDLINSPSSRVEYVVLPPDGGWGWCVVFVAFCWNVVTECTVYTFALFLDEMLKDFAVQPSLLMTASSLQCGLYYLLGPFSAAVINRFGFRITSVCGGCLAFGGLLASSYVDNIYVFITTYGGVMGVAFSMSYLSNILVVSFYFSKYRAIATSCAVTGSAVGVSISPFIFTMVLSDMDWRKKYKYLSGAHLLMVFFAFVYKPISPSVIRTREVPQHNAPRTADPSLSADEKFGRYIWDFPTAAEALANQDYVIVLRESDSRISDATYPSASQRTSVRGAGLVGLSEPTVLMYTHKKCCCCYCRCSHIICPCLLSYHRPMYRDDILYQGSMKLLPHFNRAETDLSKALTQYHMKVTRTTNALDVPQNADCCNCCPDSVLRVLSSMMDLSLLGSSAFFLLSFSGFLTYLGFYVPSVYGITHSIVCNIEYQEATYVITAIGVSNGVGRLTFGFIPLICPKCTAMLISQVTLILAGIAVIIHPFFIEYYIHLACASAFGLFIAPLSSLRTILIVDLLGLEKLTNAYGLIVLLEGTSSIIALPLNAYLHDLFHDLKIPFIFSGSVIILSSLFLMPVNRLHKWEKQRKFMKELQIGTKTRR